MTIQQNRIYIPSKWDIEISIKMDSINKTTELHVVKGKISVVQSMVLLTEHVQQLQRQLMDAEMKIQKMQTQTDQTYGDIIDTNGNIGNKNTGGTPHAS